MPLQNKPQRTFYPHSGACDQVHCRWNGVNFYPYYYYVLLSAGIHLMDDIYSIESLHNCLIRGAHLTNVQQKVNPGIMKMTGSRKRHRLPGVQRYLPCGDDGQPEKPRRFCGRFFPSEGIIESADEIRGIDITDACHGGFEVHVELSARRFAGLKERRRNMAGAPAAASAAPSRSARFSARSHRWISHRLFSQPSR